MRSGGYISSGKFELSYGCCTTPPKSPNLRLSISSAVTACIPVSYLISYPTNLIIIIILIIMYPSKRRTTELMGVSS